MKIALHIFRILTVFFGLTFLGTGVATSEPFGDESNSDQESQNPVVVELFTSQGCSSCPPADDVLSDLSQQKNILALSYSIDYWNYLGWKDTFSQPEFTLRQRKYNGSLGKRGVYTPQMIIQGAHDVIGSRTAGVRSLIDLTRQRIEKIKDVTPDIYFGPHDSVPKGMIDLKISADKDAHTKMATIWIIGYDFNKTVHIKKGELRGQTRTYHNVVGSIKRVGSWRGDDIELSFSRDDLGKGQFDDYAVLLQYDETGPIIAAARLKR